MWKKKSEAVVRVFLVGTSLGILFLLNGCGLETTRIPFHIFR